jgi:hypothetical protein
MWFHLSRAAGPPPLCPLLLPGRKNCHPPPLEVIVDHLATNPTGGDSDRRMLGRSTAVWWSGQRTSSPPPHNPSTRSLSLSVVSGHLATNKANGDGGGGRRHTTATCPAAANCCPPSACASTDNTTLPPLPQMKSHYRTVTNFMSSSLLRVPKSAGSAPCGAITAEQGQRHHH